MTVTSLSELRRLTEQRNALGKRIESNNKRMSDSRTTQGERERIRAENVRLQFEMDGLKLQVTEINTRISKKMSEWWMSDDLEDMACMIAALRRAAVQARRDGEFSERSHAAMVASERFLQEFALDTILLEDGAE